MVVKQIIRKMQNFFHIINFRRNNYRKIKKFKRFIKNGFYYFDEKSISKNWVGSTKSRIINTYLVFSAFKRTQLTTGEFFQGTYKIVFCSKGFVISYCNNIEIYQMNKNNYQLYSSVFPYPYAKTLCFDDKNQIICSEYIAGKKYGDVEHLLVWAYYVIRKTYNTEFVIKENAIYYIQHGDAWFGNVIWTNDRTFVYIDLDRMGYWPALYDIVYGLTVALKEEAFSLIENELYDEISCLFEHMGFHFSIAFLDDAYANFIKIWKKRDPQISAKYIQPFYSLDDRFVKVWILLKENN